LFQTFLRYNNHPVYEWNSFRIEKEIHRKWRIINPTKNYSNEDLVLDEFTNQHEVQLRIK
jgi:hypothetical protein